MGLWGLWEGDWHQLWHWAEGLWCHLDLFLPLEQECLLHANYPAWVSCFSHLAIPIPRGPAEGEQACEMEWMWESLWPLKEGLANLVSLCRPALALCLASSWCSSLMHLSCCLWGNTLGPIACSPCRLVLSPSGSLHRGDPKRVCMVGCSGTDSACDFRLWFSGVPLILFSLHGGHIAEHALQQEQAPFLFVVSALAQMLYA